MGRSKKEEKETFEGQLLSKLENMEKRFDKRIGKVESSLKKIEKSSGLTTEDQLFFGIVFTLLILFLQLPEFDVCTIFKSFGVVVEPTRGILTAKMVLISLLLFASVARYLTALTNKDTERNKWRLISVSFLLACFYYLITEFTIRGLTAVLININVFLIFLGPIALSVISIVVGFFVEKRWYRAYGDGSPHMSIIFGYIGVTILLAYYLAMIASFFIPISEVVSLVIVFSSFLLVYSVIKLNDFLKKRLKTKTKKKEGNG